MAVSKNKAYKSRSVVRAGDAARSERDAANVASTVKTDAVTGGLVHGGDRYAASAKRSARVTAKASSRQKGKAATDGRKAQAHSSKTNATDRQIDGQDEAPSIATAEGKTALQSRGHLRAALANAAIEEIDDSEELEGIADAERNIQAASSLARKVQARCAGQALEAAEEANASAARGARAKAGQATAARSAQAKSPATTKSQAPASNAKQAKAAKAAKEQRAAQHAKSRMQSRRAWATARAQQAQGAHAAQASSTARRAGGAKTLAAAVSSAAAPLTGVLTGVLCFVLTVLLVSQMASALFGFWDSESKKASLEGLPPYITAEMVEAALECQEKYGHPAGCTIAQIICESGMGDRLSGLATQDYNLFGIKWASSFLGCPEVSGKSAWSTQEEYDGVLVTIMDYFTSFKSYEDCIRFRSRVLLANSLYADNALIKEAIAKKDSDKMAEGLKDAGYATSSSYVESLKSILDTYNLRRFDGLSLDDYRRGAADGNAVVAAAMTQLGVPYVWGGTTPGVGLDCSGLTQYAYMKAGISIPRNSEDQAAAGTKVPLSQAKPGDILWRPGHVAIYAGGDTYIHEPHTGAVCTTATGISYFTCAVRF